jgi:hypothetical protein
MAPAPVWPENAVACLLAYIDHSRARNVEWSMNIKGAIEQKGFKRSLGQIMLKVKSLSKGMKWNGKWAKGTQKIDQDLKVVRFGSENLQLSAGEAAALAAARAEFDADTQSEPAPSPVEGESSATPKTRGKRSRGASDDGPTNTKSPKFSSPPAAESTPATAYHHYNSTEHNVATAFPENGAGHITPSTIDGRWPKATTNIKISCDRGIWRRRCHE